jgi:hypothetical protein
MISKMFYPTDNITSFLKKVGNFELSVFQETLKNMYFPFTTNIRLKGDVGKENIGLCIKAPSMINGNRLPGYSHKNIGTTSFFFTSNNELPAPLSS